MRTEQFFDQHDIGVDDACRIQRDELYQAIAQLPEREQLAIHFYYLTEQPASFAKEILKLSTSGFYKLLDRARKNLASKMASEEGIK